MKTVAIAILTFAVGLATGLRIGNHFIVGTVRNQFRSSSAQHQTLALVSVHALSLRAGIDLSSHGPARLRIFPKFMSSARSPARVSSLRWATNENNVSH